MRWLFRILGLVAALIAVAAAGLYLFFDVNRYRPRIQAQLEKELGRPVTLGSMRLQLFPPGITINDLSVAEPLNPPGGAPFLAAGGISVLSSLGAILRGEPRIDALRLVEPRIELIKLPGGEWNVSSIKPSAPPEDKGGSAGALTLLEFSLTNGRIAVTDGGKRSVYDNIDLALHDLGVAGQPTRFEASMRVAGDLLLKAEGRARLDTPSGMLRIESFNASVGAVQVNAAGSIGTGANQALDLRIEARESTVADLVRAAAAFGAGFLPGTRVNGTARANLEVRGTAEKPAITGSVQAANLDISRAEWKLPVRIPKIEIALTPGLVKSNRFVAACGATQVAAAFSVSNPGAADSFLAATVTAAGARLEELLHIAGAYGIKNAAAMSGSGEVSLDARIMGRLAAGSTFAYSGSGRLRNATLHPPSLTKPVSVRQADLRFEKEDAILDNVVLTIGGSTLQGNLAVRRFSAPDLRFKAAIDRLDATELRQISKPDGAAGPSPFVHLTGGGSLTIGKVISDGVELDDVRAEVKLDHGLLRLDPLSAGLYGGRHTGAITLDQRSAPMRIALDSRIERVEANSLISSATAIKKLISGALAGQAALSFVSRPGADIAPTLNGTFQLRLSDGRIAGFNLLNELAAIAQAAGFAKKTAAITEILDLSATLNIKDGVASTDNLRLLFPGGSLTARGMIGLADQTLKLRMTPVLSRETSNQFGGPKVGGILSTVLASRNGELVIPVLVSGTLAQPRLLPDAETMAKLKLEELSSPAAIGATVKGAIDAIKGRGAPAPPPSAAPAPAEANPPEHRIPPVSPVEDVGRKATESLLDLLKRKREKK